MPAVSPTSVVLGREQAAQYTGPHDGEMSAKAEIGLRAAMNGDHALAFAQVFALPPDMRAEYRAMLAAVLAHGQAAA